MRARLFTPRPVFSSFSSCSPPPPPTIRRQSVRVAPTFYSARIVYYRSHTLLHGRIPPRAPDAYSARPTGARFADELYIMRRRPRRRTRGARVCVSRGDADAVDDDDEWKRRPRSRACRNNIRYRLGIYDAVVCVLYKMCNPCVLIILYIGICCWQPYVQPANFAREKWKLTNVLNTGTSTISVL